jgi:hypothetical protein
MDEININDEKQKMSKSDMIFYIDSMIKSIDNLPQAAMMTPVTHYDYYSLLLLISALFKEDWRDVN